MLSEYVKMSRGLKTSFHLDCLSIFHWNFRHWHNAGIGCDGFGLGALGQWSADQQLGNFFEASAKLKDLDSEVE